MLGTYMLGTSCFWMIYSHGLHSVSSRTTAANKTQILLKFISAEIVHLWWIFKYEVMSHFSFTITVSFIYINDYVITSHSSYKGRSQKNDSSLSSRATLANGLIFTERAFIIPSFPLPWWFTECCLQGCYYNPKCATNASQLVQMTWFPQSGQTTKRCHPHCPAQNSTNSTWLFEQPKLFNGQYKKRVARLVTP